MDRCLLRHNRHQCDVAGQLKGAEEGRRSDGGGIDILPDDLLAAAEIDSTPQNWNQF